MAVPDCHVLGKKTKATVPVLEKAGCSRAVVVGVDKQACLACTRQSFYLTVLLQCSTEPIGERTFNMDFVLGTLCKASGDPLVMNMSYFPSAPAPNGCPHYLASCHRRDKDSEGYPSNLCLCIAS